MFDIALNALATLMHPTHFLHLTLGVAVGVLVGILPGIGGLVGMSILLPLTFGMDPIAALAMLLGVTAVNNTSDTFSAILIGVPGSSGSATIIDGHAMAKKGEASRALSASFMASLIGGLIGALALTLVLPVARPLLLSFGTPELLMVSFLGLCTVGVLSGNAPMKGLIAAVAGLALGAVGTAPGAPAHRMTFGNMALYDGFHLVVVTLGLFAIPEMLDFLRKGGTISSGANKLAGGWLAGLRDIVVHRWLVIRHSLIGVVVGAIPGLGSSVCDWINYGYVVQTSKDKSQFGKGDVRGLLAPDAANNAKEGGGLIPTLLFGVPGSASMAILLSAMIVVGVQPGPMMIDRNPDIIFVLVWSLAIANVMATTICFLFAQPLARLSFIPFTIIFPFIVTLVTLGVFVSTRSVTGLIFLVVFGILGWVMKRNNMARPPLLVGFILSPLIERDLGITLSRFGVEWLLRPGVMAIGMVILALIWFGARKSARAVPAT